MGVLRRGKRPIDGGLSGIGGALNPFVRLPSGTSKTSRSLLLEVSSSTINKPSEYMILKIPIFLRSPRLCQKHCPIQLATQIRIKSWTPHWLVPTVVFKIDSRLVIWNWLYQSRAKPGAG